MMRKRSYKAFTFVEMLIVMGILIILMVIGIAAGRFTINRANRVAHQNAADQVYQTLQAYYTENRQFPEKNTLDKMLSGTGGGSQDDGVLFEYTEGDFKGGAPATYYYFVQEEAAGVRQAVLVCVTLGGYEDELKRGIYCAGNGFNDDDVKVGSADAGSLSHDFIEEETYESATNDYYDLILKAEGADWNGNGWGKEASGGAGEGT